MKKDKKGKEKNSLMIRNSTAEFLIFTAQTGEDGIEVRVEDENVWLTQKLIAKLFGVEINTINYHLKDIFKSKELKQGATIRTFRIVQKEGRREVSRSVEHYNLEAIIAIGFRVNSERAANFRRWANQVLKDFAVRGYVLDRKRLENGAFLGRDYYEKLLEEIREIRLSERRFYQKVTDIYATSVDYDKNALTTKDFFAKVQNKLHFAIHGKTVAELIKARSDSRKENMGLTVWERSPNGKILKSDVSVAKNYLTDKELKSLGRLVNAFLDLAEERAERRIPMTMEDWSKRLDKFLDFDERKILEGKGRISAEMAKEFAESEWEKYRITQDRIFESDFDREMKRMIEEIGE